MSRPRWRCRPANGAEVAWLIDPLEKAIVISRPGEQPEASAAYLRPGHRAYRRV